MMRRLGHPQFYRERREKLVYYVYRAESDKKRRADFGHEVRGVKEMQGLQDSEPDQNVYGKNAENVRPAYTQDTRTHLAEAEEKPDGQQKNGESAGIDRVYERRYADPRQHQAPAVGQIPDNFRSVSAEAQEKNRGQKQNRQNTNNCESGVHVKA